MYRHCDDFKQHVFLLLFILQFIFLALSDDNPFWCSKVQNEANEVWSGENISRRFHLKDPLLDTQILMWTKGNSIWVKRYNGQCKSDEACAPSRYRMAEVSNVSFHLFIDYAEQDDSGHHVVTLYQGRQSICTALKMNLTVITPEPVCSTRLDKNEGKLQMSCQWVQMNEGDRAHFEVESEVLYEHQIPELNFNGIFNMTHQFSVNVGLHRMANEITLPSQCIVSQRKGKVREMCNFPLVIPKSFKQFEYTHIESVEFRCCVGNLDIPIPLLYDGDGQKFPVGSVRKYTSREDNCILLFLCGAMEDHAKVTIFNMESLDIRKHAKYGISTLWVSVEERKLIDDTSREDRQCKILIVNFKYLNSTLDNLDGISTEILVTQNCDSVEATKTVSNTLTISPRTENQGILLAVAAVAASVLAFIVGVCITKWYNTYKVQGKHHYLVRRNTSADPQRGPPGTEDDGAEALVMTTFTTQTLQQDGDVGSQRLVINQPPSDEELQCFKRETTGQYPRPSTFPLRREMIKNDSGGRSEGIKRSNGQQNAPVFSASKPIPESTYCSVDDVEYMPSKAKNHELHSKPNQSCPSSSRKKAVRDDWKGTSSPTPDLDALYAKPDMSQKTKNKASLESEYDDPRPLGDDFFQSLLLQENDPPTPSMNTHHAYHVYGNSVESPTDESTTDGELYSIQVRH